MRKLERLGRSCSCEHFARYVLEQPWSGVAVGVRPMSVWERVTHTAYVSRTVACLELGIDTYLGLCVTLDSPWSCCDGACGV